MTLAMLAIHQDDQDRVFKHITSVVGDSDPVSDSSQYTIFVFIGIHPDIR